MYVGLIIGVIRCMIRMFVIVMVVLVISVDRWFVFMNL